MSRFTPSPMFDEITQDVTRPQRLATAHRIVAGARSANTDDTGHYDQSLHTFSDRRGIGAQTDDIFGHGIEYGSINNPAQAPLRTAAANAGRFDPL